MTRPSNRATPSVPGSHSGKVRRQVMPDFIAHSCGPLWKSCRRRLAAPSRCGRLSLGRWESTMHAPERWPFGDIESWWAWRDHLDRVQDLNIATLKREADCEIARILRCCEARWEPKRPRLVPPRTGAGSGVRG